MADRSPSPEKASRDPRGVLVTGAAGELARRTIRRLRDNGHKVVGVDFRGGQASHPETVDYEVDFNKRTFEDVFREHDFHAVLHLGRIQSSELDRNRRFSSNVIGTDRLFRLCLKYGIDQVLVLSTYHVYGADPHNPSLIEEDFPLKAAGLTQDLVDAVELENLANIRLYQHPELNITILRPCNIVGPGVRNTLSRMLAQRAAPCMGGFSPLMQFIHVEDMAEAVELAFEHNRPGVYNVAPDDYISFQDALELAGCRRLFLTSVPEIVPRTLAGLLGRYSFPTYLIGFFKYPVVIDGSKFATTFGFAPKHTFNEIFADYREVK